MLSIMLQTKYNYALDKSYYSRYFNNFVIASCDKWIFTTSWLCNWYPIKEPAGGLTWWCPWWQSTVGLILIPWPQEGPARLCTILCFRYFLIFLFNNTSSTFCTSLIWINYPEWISHVLPRCAARSACSHGVIMGSVTDHYQWHHQANLKVDQLQGDICSVWWL